MTDEHDHTDTDRPDRLLGQVRRQWRLSPLLTDPFHQQVWQAACAIADRGERADPLRVQRELTTDDEQHLHDPARLMGLVEDCHPAHASRYAGIVVEAAMHRRTHELAGTAYAAAEATATGDTEQASTAVARMRGQLQRMWRYWQGLSQEVRGELVRTTGPTVHDPAQRAKLELAELAHELQEMQDGPLQRAVTRLLGVIDGLANASIDAPRSPDADRVHLVPGQALDADWAGYYRELRSAAAEHPDAAVPVVTDRPTPRGVISLETDQAFYADVDAQRPSGPDEQRQIDERTLLATLIAHPTAVDQVPLNLDSIDDPDVRAGVALVQDMHASNVTVDGVSAAWSARQRGVVLPDLPDAVTVAEAAHLGLRVNRAAAAQRLRTTGDRLRSAAISPHLDPPAMLSAASAALAHVGDLSRERDTASRTPNPRETPEVTPPETAPSEPEDTRTAVTA